MKKPSSDRDQHGTFHAASGGQTRPGLQSPRGGRREYGEGHGSHLAMAQGAPRAAVPRGLAESCPSGAEKECVGANAKQALQSNIRGRKNHSTLICKKLVCRHSIGTSKSNIDTP